MTTTTLDQQTIHNDLATDRPPAARPVSLSDDELSAIMRACDPLPPDRRGAFVQEVARMLGACGEIGPGSVFRVIRDVQKQFFVAPDLSRGRDCSRWR